MIEVITEVTDEFPGMSIYTISAGDKELTVSVYFRGSTIKSDGQIRKLDEKRISGATSAIYQELALQMQDLANRKGREIVYEFVSDNLKMRLWAKSARGKEAMRWDDIWEEGRPPEVKAIRTFRPNRVR